MSVTETKKANTQGFEKSDVEENKVIAGLCYLNPILGFLQMNKSKFVKFHLNQILTLIIPSVILAVFGGILSVIFMPKPSEATSLESLQNASQGAGAVAVVYGLIGILSIPIVIVASMNMLAALKGEAKRIPIVGGITIIPNSNEVDAEDVFEIDKLKNIQFSGGGQSIKCEKCGSSVGKDKKFCSSCGSAVNEPKNES